jgi:hypothetical protein
MLSTVHQLPAAHLGRDVVAAMGRVRLWINVYHLAMCYGGPEEGGWWWDRGTPVPGLSRSFSTRRRARQKAAAYLARAIDLVVRMHREEFRYDYESVCGGETYVVRVEEHPPRPFPARRPHYE